MEHISAFDSQSLEAICKIIADTNDGLSGTEIDRFLAECKIPDITPGITKWKRLFNALVSIQNEKGYGNHTIMIITRSMNPVRFTTRRELFEQQLERLNAVLAFLGLELGSDGKLRRAKQAKSLEEALTRANRLRTILEARSVHSDVLKFCKAELLQENYFHAVFEAMKSISAKIRAQSGLTSDGANLVTEAFSCGKKPKPLLAINSLGTETDRGEQRGFMNLLIGLFGTIRNPAAHNPKIEWPMSENDALDILTTASLIHRKLDRATKCEP